MYDEVAALDVSSEIGVRDEVSAGVSDAELRPLLPLDADVENWPCIASNASIVAGDSAPEPGLLDRVEPEPDCDESELDIVNGSAPLVKNPVDCVEDEEVCEARDLTASHAADAAPKAISMIKTSKHAAGLRPALHHRLVSKRRARRNIQ